jgi:hypothetical protein
VPVLLLLAGAVILVGVVGVAMGRGGEMAEFPSDYLPPALDDLFTAADVAALRPPPGLWGYNIRVTDEALSRVAQVVTERDVEIAVLRQQLAELRAAGPLAQRAGSRHPVVPPRVAVVEQDAVPLTGQEPGIPAAESLAGPEAAMADAEAAPAGGAAAPAESKTGPAEAEAAAAGAAPADAEAVPPDAEAEVVPRDPEAAPADPEAAPADAEAVPPDAEAEVVPRDPEAAPADPEAAPADAEAEVVPPDPEAALPGAGLAPEAEGAGEPAAVNAARRHE